MSSKSGSKKGVKMRSLSVTRQSRNQIESARIPSATDRVGAFVMREQKLSFDNGVNH
jgi:hypothetical protein